MKLDQKDWSCPKKQEARRETVISQYQKHFGHKLPLCKQYWTMSGQCATNEGCPIKGTEISHVVDCGLISTKQFHGVEIDKEIYDVNVKAFPNANWHCGDFYESMRTAVYKGHFNPGLINCDLVKTPTGGAKDVSKIMSFLTETTDSLLFIANFIIRKRFYQSVDGDFIIESLNKYTQFQYAIEKGKWELIPNYYEYDGAGYNGSRTWMGSVIFLKR